MSDQSRKTVLIAVLKAATSVLICLLLVAAAAGGLYWIYSTEPEAQREGATRKTAALVETLVVSRDTYRPELVVLGNVQPARDIELSPLVGGEITEVDPSFVPGGIVDKGQPLIKIDPADYAYTVTLRKSELQQAQADLAIEQGRQAVAKKEFEALGREVSGESRALVLREPQIATIRARIDAAQAAIDQAELDLQRTSLAAPFHAQIISRLANLGSQVAAGEPVARLVGVEEYWVIASVPLRQLKHIVFDDNTERPGSPVKLRMHSAWEPGVTRDGRVTRLIGELDPQARMAQVLITVADPMSLQTDGPPLLLGTILEATITGIPLQDVVRLPRDYLRQNDTVWVMADGKLAIRKVELVYGNAEFVYISQGLNPGDEVVTTALSTVVEGRALRRVADAQDTSADAPAEDSE